ncbi:MAG TPA: hypothetical protein VND94_10500 [Terriglobia bacterium]|nr:hypothetical protein [Terriglobia bacterium]
MLHRALSVLSGMVLPRLAGGLLPRGRHAGSHRLFRRGAVRRLVRKFVSGVIGFLVPQVGLGVLVPVPVRARRRR